MRFPIPGHKAVQSFGAFVQRCWRDDQRIDAKEARAIKTVYERYFKGKTQSFDATAQQALERIEADDRYQVQGVDMDQWLEDDSVKVYGGFCGVFPKARARRRIKRLFKRYGVDEAFYRGNSVGFNPRSPKDPNRKGVGYNKDRS